MWHKGAVIGLPLYSDVQNVVCTIAQPPEQLTQEVKARACPLG